MTETKYEYKNDFGQWHRDGDLPAVETIDGTKEWWDNGVLHRGGDCAAIEYSDGTKHWYLNGILHRGGDRPAVEGLDGFKSWFDNGKRHRETGPAIDMDSGEKVWWFLHGKFLTAAQTNAYVSFCQKMKEKRRIRAQKKIYFWWIQICYDMSHPSGCGQRMAHRNLELYEAMVKDNV